jgi:phospholipid/cholesterol/gamma-HCH transport system substrate-binding protein
LAQLQEVVNEKNVHKIDLMLTNLQQSTAQLSLLMKHRRREMEESITHANRLLANFDTITTQNKGSIDSSMAAFNQSMQHFKKVSGNLERTSIKLDAILAKINNGKGSAGKLVNDSSFYNNLDSLSVNLNRLIENINRNPTKYLKGLKLIDIF